MISINSMILIKNLDVVRRVINEFHLEHRLCSLTKIQLLAVKDKKLNLKEAIKSNLWAVHTILKIYLKKTGSHIFFLLPLGPKACCASHDASPAISPPKTSQP